MIIPARLKWSRWWLGGLAVGLMALMYVFQRRVLWPEINDAQLPYLPFILNRFFRLIINDTLCLALFLAIFNRKNELRLASVIFMLEVVIILPLYLVIKLTLEGDAEISSPLLSFIHRLIVNPLLMMILLGSLLYQRFVIEKTT